MILSFKREVWDNTPRSVWQGCLISTKRSKTLLLQKYNPISYAAFITSETRGQSLMNLIRDCPVIDFRLGEWESHSSSG